MRLKALQGLDREKLQNEYKELELSLIHLLDPEKRTLKQIRLEDAVKADEIFTLLMGEKVEPRKEYIEQNAKYVVNLDY